MATQQLSKSRAVRAKFTHPVIDSDGHTVEFEPALHDTIKQVGGASVLERYLSRNGRSGWYRRSPEERREHHTVRPPWWALPTKNTLDRATATLPKLLAERLERVMHFASSTSQRVST